MKCRIVDAINEGVKILKGKHRPRLQCEILLSFVLQKQRVFLHTHFDELIDQCDFKSYQELLLRAKNDEPLEYLIGKVGFYGYEWEINEGVLIPRPETEILVNKADHLIKEHQISRVFEFGVGSGIVSITLALLNSKLEILASDINPRALELTEKNIQRFCALDPTLRQRIVLSNQNILQDWGILDASFEAVISNPPYISNSYELPKNVSYEPKEALFGGEGGEEILYALIDLCEVRQISFLACEMGYDQKFKMQGRLGPFWDVDFYQDLAGLDRGFVAKNCGLIAKN